MRHLLKANFTLFIVDVLVLVLATGADILMFRYALSAVLGFDTLLAFHLLISSAAACIAVFVTKTYRIVFSGARFNALMPIVGCAALKSALYGGSVLALSISMYSWLVIVGDFCFSFVLLTLLKLVFSSFSSIVNEVEGKDVKEEKFVTCLNVAVYGTSPKSISIVTRYENSRQYNVIAFLSTDRMMKGKILMGKRVIYVPEDVSDFGMPDVEAVLFSSLSDMRHESDHVVKMCNEMGLCVMSIPSAERSNYTGMEVSEIKHMLENRFIPDHMSGIARAVKRICDIAASSALIVLFSPVMLVIYLVIKKNDGTPVLYRQERIGRFGRPFHILKFRSMRLDAESGGPALYAGDDDPRLTKTGRFLRVHHLDELPQLFNVFVGDMSFVGYRPERKVFIDKIVEKDPRYAYLYQIRPGVTSYATLKNGYTDTLDKMLVRLNYDLYYLNHRSILFDAKVLWHTFLNIMFGKRF